MRGTGVGIEGQGHPDDDGVSECLRLGRQSEEGFECGYDDVVRERVDGLIARCRERIGEDGFLDEGFDAALTTALNFNLISALLSHWSAHPLHISRANSGSAPQACGSSSEMSDKQNYNRRLLCSFCIPGVEDWPSRLYDKRPSLST